MEGTSRTISRAHTARVTRIARPLLLLSLLVLALPAAADGLGTPLGKRRVRSVIHAADDVDLYMVEARAGSTVRVLLKVPGKSALVAVADFVDADGAPTGEFVPKGNRLLGTLDVEEDARVVVRIASADGGTGEYSISARAKGAGRTSRRDIEIEAGEEYEVTFAAGGGARVDFSIRGRKGAPNLARLLGPRGELIALPEGAVRRRATKLTGKKILLPAEAPFGTWTLVAVASSGALSGLRATVKVKGGGLAPWRGKLLAPEPALTHVSPTEAGPGTLVTVHGTGLALPVRLFADGVEMLDVDQDRLQGTFPTGLEGPVEIAALASNGHVAILRDAVLAVQPPQISGIDPARGPADGGTLIDVVGARFRPGAVVTLAGVGFPGETEFVSDALLRFTTPAFAAGSQTFGVRDPTSLETTVGGGFEFVSAPAILDVRPRLVPQLAGETLRIDGGALAPDRAVLTGDLPPLTIASATPTRIDLTLDTLPLGPHDVVVTDDLGQSATAESAFAVFTFESLAPIASTGGPPPDAMTAADYDGDDDLDLFVVSRGGGTLGAASALRVFRNNGDGTYTDVSDDVLPAITIDDWRAGTIAVGDVAADVGEVPSDGWADIVLGSMDDTVLPADRSRVRVLANRAGAGGERVFVDRTSILFASPSAYDDWCAEDLWIGDLDGDGGVPDIVATHDATPTGVSPLTPFYTYYLSGTRVFSFAANESGYGQFAHQSERFPHVIGTQAPTQGFQQCISGACADDYTPFRGTSLAVVDLNGDGRRDVAVTSPSGLVRNGVAIASTQVAQNIDDILGVRMEDRSTGVSASIDTLRGDIVLPGDVTGSTDPDLVVVSHTASGSGIAVQIAEFRGFTNTWAVRGAALLPGADGGERLQADDADLLDVDGDGDLDLVLLTSTVPTGGSTTTGRGLRILRNLGASGFGRELEMLLPSVAAAGDLAGRALVVADLDDDDGLVIVVGSDDGTGSGGALDAVRRTLSD